MRVLHSNISPEGLFPLGLLWTQCYRVLDCTSLYSCQREDLPDVIPQINKDLQFHYKVYRIKVTYKVNFRRNRRTFTQKKIKKIKKLLT